MDRNDQQSEYSLVIYEQAILCGHRGPSQNLSTLGLSVKMDITFTGKMESKYPLIVPLKVYHHDVEEFFLLLVCRMYRMKSL